MWPKREKNHHVSMEKIDHYLKSHFLKHLKILSYN
jgi:hypothetical protein